MVESRGGFPAAIRGPAGPRVHLMIPKNGRQIDRRDCVAAFGASTSKRLANSRHFHLKLCLRQILRMWRLMLSLPQSAENAIEGEAHLLLKPVGLQRHGLHAVVSRQRLGCGSVYR